MFDFMSMKMQQPSNTSDVNTIESPRDQHILARDSILSNHQEINISLHEIQYYRITKRSTYPCTRFNTIESPRDQHILARDSILSNHQEINISLHEIQYYRITKRSTYPCTRFNTIESPRDQHILARDSIRTRVKEIDSTNNSSCYVWMLFFKGKYKTIVTKTNEFVQSRFTVYHLKEMFR